MIEKYIKYITDMKQSLIDESEKYFNDIQKVKSTPFLRPSGRMGRIGFITSCPFYTFFFVLILLFTIALAFFNLIAGGVMAIMLTGAYLYLIAMLIIKRLHDCNHHAVFFLLILMPFWNVVFLLYLMLMPGKKSTNNYGENEIRMPLTIAIMNLLTAAFFTVILVSLVNFVPFAGIINALIETEQFQLMLLEHNIGQQRFTN